MSNPHFTPHISRPHLGPMGELVARVVQLEKSPISLRRNYDVRCYAGVDGGPTGEYAVECGRPTVACTDCGAWTELCPEHAWQADGGAPLCEECFERDELAKGGL